MKNKNLTFGFEFDNNYLYFVTNNVNLRSYLSLDSIVSNNCLETSNFYKMDSNMLDNYLILSNKIITTSHRISLEDLNLYKIILEIDLNGVDVQLLSNLNNEIKMTNLKDEDITKFDCFMLFGTIPFQFIKRIIFRNDEELNRFSYMLDNVHYPTHLFGIDDKIFFNEKYIDHQEISENVKNYITRNRIDLYRINSIVHYRNKIKAIMCAALFSNIQNDNGLICKFDSFTLDYLNISKKDKLKLNNRMNELCSTHKFKDFKKVNFHKNRNKDSVINRFSELLNFLNLENKEYLEMNKGETSNEFTVEFIILLESISLLIHYNYLEPFNSEEFLKVLNSNLTKYSSTSIEKLIDDINNIILEVLRDNLSIKKILLSNSIKSDVFLALMIFLKSPSFNSSQELIRNLESYGVDFEVKRLVYILYYSLNGYAVIGSSNKENPYVNRICENLSFGTTYDKHLISEKINELRFETYNPKDDSIFYTESNIPLEFKLYYTENELLSEKHRLILAKMISFDSLASKKIISYLLKNASQIKNSLPIKVIIDKKNLNSFSEDETRISFTISNQSFIKKEIDINSFEKIILNYPKIFLDYFNSYPDIWKALINKEQTI